MGKSERNVHANARGRRAEDELMGIGTRCARTLIIFKLIATTSESRQHIFRRAHDKRLSPWGWSSQRRHVAQSAGKRMHDAARPSLCMSWRACMSQRLVGFTKISTALRKPLQTSALRH